MLKYGLRMIRAFCALTAVLLGTGCFEPYDAAPPDGPKPDTRDTVAFDKSRKTFVYATHGTIDSLDPVKAYDSASGAQIQNLYETLIAYDGSAVDTFIPVLAEEVPTRANGGISADGKTYRFKIRKDVVFHSGNPLMPEDVRYSLLRALVVDPSGGPCWLLSFPLLGRYESRKDGKIDLDFNAVARCVQVEGDEVVCRLPKPFAPFLSILAGYWASIVDRQFVAEQGGWDGKSTSWERFNNPDEGAETLYEVASGTGPYRLERWTKKTEVVFKRFDNYWGEPPATETAIYKIVDEWQTRKMMLMQGDADAVEVEPTYYKEVDQEKGLKVYRDLQMLIMQGVIFNMDIKGAMFTGSGKLDGKGIPPDFMRDIHVRQGLICCWDQDTYINDILAGNGVTIYTPHVRGLPYFNDQVRREPFDLKKAEQHFRQAWNGQVWEVGFAFDALYNSGNDIRAKALYLLKENLEKLNPRFTLNVRGIEWAQILDYQRQRQLPILNIGWAADFPDPANFMQPYLHSQGLFASRCGYRNPEADQLIDAGALIVDPEKRRDIYYRLQQIWIEDALGIVMHQSRGNRYFRDKVQGYVWHPMENAYRFAMFRKTP